MKYALLHKPHLLLAAAFFYALTSPSSITASSSSPREQMQSALENKGHVRSNDPLLLPVIMIKNEASVIGKTLQPFVDAGIQHFFVFDTGSTDDTIQVTEEFFKKNNIKHWVIKQEEFIDFCTSRNRALKLAEEAFPDAGFIVMPDAEWYLKNTKKLIDFCEKHKNDPFDIYGVRIINSANLDYLNQRLFRCGKNGKFEGAVHEYSVGYEGETVPLDVYFEWAPTPQGIEKSRGRWLRDKEILIREYFKKPEDARTVFYLAQTYECLGDQDNARDWYEKRITMQGFLEERFVAHCRLAKIYENQGNWTRSLELCLKAYAERPHRAESLIQVAQHYYTSNEQPLCYLFAKQAADMAYPSQDILFIQKEMYDFIRHDLLGVGAWYVGDLQRGKEAVINALQVRPNEHHLLRNLSLYVRRERETKKSLPPAPIVNLHFGTPEPGGVESHLVMFNKLFSEHGFSTKVLTSPHAKFVVDTLTSGNYGTPCATYRHNDFIPRTGDMIEQCPSVIICNFIGQLASAIKVREFMPVKLIYVQHNYYCEYSPQEIALLNQVDGIVAVSPLVTARCLQLKQQGELKVPVIKTITPFFDDQKFLNFKPTRSKKEYFVQQYNLNLDTNRPIITMLANMYFYKNHKLLINAANILRNKGKKFYVLLAGVGPDFEANKKLVAQLGLEDEVRFLGLVLDTPELLYNVDLHVLASTNESFGVVHAEAALMKKPFVGATGTGMESFIEQGVTGFSFANNNAQELAQKLEYLLDNPAQRIAMGNNAYNKTMRDFSSEAIFTQWQEFLVQTI